MEGPTDGTVLRISPDTRRVIVRIFSAILLLVVVAVCLSLIGVIRNPHPPGQLITITLIFLAGGGLVILGVQRSKVVLYADRIEVTRYPWPVRTVVRSDIVARRLHPYSRGSAAHYVLITRDGREVKLPPYLEHRKILLAWMSDIPLASRLPKHG